MIIESTHSRNTRIIGGVLTGLAYYAVALVFIPLVDGPNAAVPMWVPSGIAVAGSVFFGLWVVPFVWLGSFVSALPASSALIAATMATAAVIEVVVFRWLLRRVWRNGVLPSGLGSALGIGQAIALAPLVPAVLSAAGMAIAGWGQHSVTLTFVMWWVSEVAGIGAIGAIAILWNAPRRTRTFAQRVEGTGAVFVTVAATVVLYSVTLPVPVERVVPFFFLPLFTWIAYRCEGRGMALTVASVSMIATVATIAGRGPFAGAALDDSLLALNIVIGVFAFSSLVLVMLFQERERFAAVAESARADLETRVHERTAALSLANESLMQQIAERRRAEEELAERELSFRLLYERAPLAYQSLDPDGSFLDVNDAWLDLFGYRRDEILGSWFGDVLVDGQAAVFAERFMGFKASGSVNGAPFNVRCKDGSVCEVAVYGRIAHSDDGSIRRTHCILQDMTRFNAEVDALRASREHFASLFENSHTIMTLVDPATARFVDVNAAACDFYGYGHDEFLGMTIMDLNGTQVDDMLGRLSETGAGSGVRLDRHRLASGEFRDMEIHSGPVEISGERLLFATMQDVSGRVAAEQEVAEHRERLAELVRERTDDLERAYVELESAGAAKDQFLANMSHELRTPLNSIIGFSDMLLSGLVGEMDAEQQRQIGMINASGKHLLELVNDVLDLTRVASGTTPVEPEEFELTPLLESVIESVRPQAHEKRLDLRVAQATPITVIRSDRRKVRQILLNLIGNAIKFTDTGSVVLRVTCDGRETVSFAVADTGIGIAPDEIERVFDEFHQVAAPHETKPSGTGLGLPISLRLARILGGDLVVSSVVGQGSVFTFTLPAVVPCTRAVRP